MEFLNHYWWILVILLIIGILMNAYKDLNNINPKKLLDNKLEKPHCDCNSKWDKK